MVMDDLKGSVSLVVGGASGIGRAVVEGLLCEGSLVSVLDLEEPMDMVGLEGENLHWIKGNATHPNASTEAVESTVARFGRIDTLVCCVGRFDFHTPICSLDLERLAEAFDEIYAVNVKSSLLSIRAAISQLRKSHGSIILTLSSSGFYPEGGGVLYGSSKWAARGLVTHLARELAPNVRVNGVAPGGTVGTSLRGVKAIGEERSVAFEPGREDILRSENLLQLAPNPQDHVGAYLYLASRNLSKFVTGAIINSDGGRGARLAK